jgi:tRNA threonylcarbamoyladenosine biosynthesis protein TsaB
MAEPLILAVDTTHEFGSLALARGAEVVDEMPLHSADGFGHLLYGYLDELLRRNGVVLAEVNCFAAASGPGSFTGVRIGLACVKGLAEALGRPAIGVSNLQAIASFGSAALRATVMDARRGDIYGAVYDATGRLIQSETVSKFLTWRETLPAGDLEILSPDFESADGTVYVVKKTPRAIAGAVARLALDALLRGDAGDPAALDANYVRRSDAELFWKDAG